MVEKVKGIDPGETFSMYENAKLKIGLLVFYNKHAYQRCNKMDKMQSSRKLEFFEAPKISQSGHFFERF